MSYTVLIKQGFGYYLAFFSNEKDRFQYLIKFRNLSTKS